MAQGTDIGPAADRVVVLQRRTADDLPQAVRDKVRVIVQSADPPTRRERARPDVFEIAVVGHRNTWKP